MVYVYIFGIFTIFLFIISSINLYFTLKIYLKYKKSNPTDNTINKVYKKLSKNKTNINKQ